MFADEVRHLSRYRAKDDGERQECEACLERALVLDTLQAEREQEERAQVAGKQGRQHEIGASDVAKFEVERDISGCGTLCPFSREQREHHDGDTESREGSVFEPAPGRRLAETEHGSRQADRHRHRARCVEVCAGFFACVCRYVLRDESADDDPNGRVDEEVPPPPGISGEDPTPRSRPTAAPP